MWEICGTRLCTVCIVMRKWQQTSLDKDAPDLRELESHSMAEIIAQPQVSDVIRAGRKQALSAFCLHSQPLEHSFSSASGVAP